jgi:hypothetical protein
VDIEIFEWLPFRSAYQFFTDEVFGESANAIGTPKDRYKSSTLHRTKLVSLLESKKLLNEYMETYWPSGWTEKGQSQPDGVRRIFDASSSSTRIEEEEAQEDTEGASFAYEEDLKNYLADNLTIIEPGLTLYKNENGLQGIEYPVDANNRRIDILALDNNRIPVVIQLKVSRGYEKVIGQCLYYKNRVKKLLGADKVRIVIIAREITRNLKAATEALPDIELFEYILSVKLVPIR